MLGPLERANANHAIIFMVLVCCIKFPPHFCVSVRSVHTLTQSVFYIFLFISHLQSLVPGVYIFVVILTQFVKI
jgi:hypothetical protein